MRADSSFSRIVRLVLLLGTSSLSTMCGDDAKPKPHGDAGTTLADAGSGTPGGGADGGIDGGHVGNLPDGGGATVADSGVTDSLDGGPAADAGADGGGSHPLAAWHLWVMETTTGHLFGYAPSQLTATNGDAPELDVTLSDKIQSLHFDAQGNLWGTQLNGGTTIFKYAAADLLHNGSISPVARFTEMAAGNVYQIAFDKSGNLWTSGTNTHGFYRYEASALTTLTATTSALTPTLLTSLGSPTGMVFDAQNDLYGMVYPGGGVANPARYNASQLVGTGAITDAPSLALSPPIGFYADTLLSASGQLVFVVETVYRYGASQIAMTGSVSTQPAETTFAIADFRPYWGTYDPTGALWLTDNHDKLLAISTTDLAMTGAVNVTSTVRIRPPTSLPSAQFGSVAVH